ncbi:MAG TPA: response regulator [Oligoflexus sp.]|uniref:response regulator n=1 Tax=Oligoflexus sp. TaxID=1971216 RepID=UPI002D45E55B|nr:response regulator [Oligoflexus sp.]HYX33899.1 response regulator [Oligoflexus sp.]
MTYVLKQSCAILVLEDSTSFGNSLAKVAIELGIDLTLCRDFQVFSELTKENQFDLAVVDIDSLKVELNLVVGMLNSKPLVVISADALAQTKRSSWPDAVKGVFSTHVKPKDLLGAVLQFVPRRQTVADEALHYLLIDDDHSFAKIAIRAAASSGIRLSWVDTLQKLDSNKSLNGYDVVLLDYDLEKTTGFDVAEILNTTAQRKPIVMVSTSNRPIQDSLFKLPNIIGFVSKWGSPHDFVLKTFQIYDEHQSRTARSMSSMAKAG